MRSVHQLDQNMKGSKKRSIFYLCRLCCLVQILGHAHSFSGGLLYDWNSVLSTKANFGDMSYFMFSALRSAYQLEHVF